MRHSGAQSRQTTYPKEQPTVKPHEKLLQEIGLRIKTIRESRTPELTQAALGRAAGSAAKDPGRRIGQIENWDPSKKDPVSVETLLRIITEPGGLNMTLGEFFLPWLPKLDDRRSDALRVLTEALYDHRVESVLHTADVLRLAQLAVPPKAGPPPQKPRRER